MPRLPADNRTPSRKWIVQQFKALLPNPTDVTKVSLDDAGSARAWGHCTIRGCTATVSCAVNIQLDHVFITCFQRGVHSHLLAAELDRNAALDLAACVSHKSPKKGRAELLARKPAVPICNLPTRKEHQRARRCFLKKQPKFMASSCHAALSWQQRLADRAANGAAFSQDGFLFYPFCGLDDTLETLSHWGRLANLQVPPHSYVFMSRHMVDFTRAHIAAGGVRSFKQCVLLGNFTWMPSYSGYAIGLWAHASQHTYSAGKSAQHLPKSQAIPAAYQWVPRNTMHVEAFGLITLVSVYKKHHGIDLGSLLSAVMLDGRLSGHDSIQQVLPPGTLFARNLPHQSRIIATKNFDRSSFNSKCGKRRRHRHPGPDRLRAVCDAGSQSSVSVSGARNLGVCSAGSAPGLLLQAKARAGQCLQDKSFCCAQASSSVKSACAKAHLQLVSLCCPTTLLESEVIDSIIGYYVGIGLTDIAESWNSHWVRRNENTGLWSSLCSSNLMCGLIPGYMPSSCFHAEERTYRMLMEGVASSSRQTSADHVTDCLQESSSPSLCTLCLFCWGNDFFTGCTCPWPSSKPPEEVCLC